MKEGYTRVGHSTSLPCLLGVMELESACVELFEAETTPEYRTSTICTCQASKMGVIFGSGGNFTNFL